jgi:hypothetical protein
MAVMRASPFEAGLRFRSVRPGQGVQSECSNLCHDLWNNADPGPAPYVVVDPQVRHGTASTWRWGVAPDPGRVWWGLHTR